MYRRSFPFLGRWNIPAFHLISSVQSLSCVRVFGTAWTAARQASLSIPAPGACSNSCPSSQWCHPTISSSVVCFSSCLQSCLASGSFPMSQLFASAGQSVGASASASVLPMNIQDLFPLGWTGWISLQSKGLSRVFSNTTVQKSISSLGLSFCCGPSLTSYRCEISSYRCTIVLSFYLLMGILGVSSFWLLEIKLLWLFLYKSFCGYTRSFVLGQYLGVE